MRFDFKKGLSNTHIVVLVLVVLGFALAITLGAQYFIELNRTQAGNKAPNAKDSYEISKLDAEIRQIRSDTGGSLFALKVIALFVTVGGAVGGYLIGQSRTTQARISREVMRAKIRPYSKPLQICVYDAAGNVNHPVGVFRDRSR